MKNVTTSILLRPTALALMGALMVGFAWPLASAAQDKTSDATTHKHTGQSTDADNDLSAQLKELKAKAAALEAALMKRYPGAAGKDATPSRDMRMMGSGGMEMMGGKGMGMMGGGDDDEMAEMMKTMRTMMEMKMMQMRNKGMMGGMSGMQGEDMGAMPGKGMGMMGMEMMGGKGMEMMGGMTKGMGGMQTPSALPGFPGASHIYHVGATGFFLDHPDHIQLTDEQQAGLNGIKEKATLQQATTQRKIDEAEQELWTLTASDEPDVEKIDAKVREIEKLRGDQRIAFIQSVGEAANVLTDEQRQVLLGHAKPQEHKHTPPPAK